MPKSMSARPLAMFSRSESTAGADARVARS
jgi:hypothetical protein